MAGRRKDNVRGGKGAEGGSHQRVNIVLTGFMGTGKSAAGRMVARQLGEKFVDLDSIIEGEAGRAISEIFATDGEARFRAIETDAINRLTRGEFGAGLVVSTGGGAVVDPENRARLKAWGVLICLTATVDEIMKRVGGTSHRPLLNKKDAREEAARLMEERASAYADCHATIDTTGLKLEAVADKILEAAERAATK